MSPRLFAFALPLAAFVSPYAATSQTPATVTTPIVTCVNVATGTSRIVNSPGNCLALVESPLVYDQTGTQGPQGPVGARGPQGAQGMTGATGATGPAGPMGVPGQTGPVGNTGATGPQGLQGQPGSIGPTGAPGAPGTQGLIGPAGPTGPTGVAGLQGAPGAGVGQVYSANSRFSSSSVGDSLSNLYGPVTGLGTFLDSETAETTTTLPVPLACTAGNFNAVLYGASGPETIEVQLQASTLPNVPGKLYFDCTINVPSDGSTASCTASGPAPLQAGTFLSIILANNSSASGYGYLTNANLYTSFTCN